MHPQISLFRRAIYLPPHSRLLILSTLVMGVCSTSLLLVRLVITSQSHCKIIRSILPRLRHSLLRILKQILGFTFVLLLHIHSFLWLLGVIVLKLSPLARVLILERSEEHTSELQSQSNLVCR